MSKASAVYLSLLFALLLVPHTTLAGTTGREALVTSMDTVQCSGNAGVMAALSGVPATQKMCSEYVLESPNVLYRVRPHKHDTLLPVGELVWLRFGKNHLHVRVDDSDQDYEFDIVTMELTARPARNKNDMDSALNSAAGPRSEHLRVLGK